MLIRDMNDALNEELLNKTKFYKHGSYGIIQECLAVVGKVSANDAFKTYYIILIYVKLGFCY
jgi:hypothetical protein